MSLIGWLALGVIAGLIADRFAVGTRGNLAVDVALGVAGSLGGGFMFLNFGGGSIRNLDIYSMVVAGTGALTALMTYHALFVYPGDGAD